jgi:hypothetical protein
VQVRGRDTVLEPYRDSRSHTASRVIRRKTNRRHMIGDRHGRAADTATLLFTATDGILGTHRSAPLERAARRTSKRRAVSAYCASIDTGNPLSERKLAAMFGKTSSRWALNRMAEAPTDHDYRSAASSFKDGLPAAAKRVGDSSCSPPSDSAYHNSGRTWCWGSRRRCASHRRGRGYTACRGLTSE